MEILNIFVYGLYGITAFFMLSQLFENGRELKKSGVKIDQNERILIQNQRSILFELSELKYIASQSKAQNEVFLKEVVKLRESHLSISERIDRIEARIDKLEDNKKTD